MLVFAAWSLVLIAWLTLHWGILPRIDHWRPQIEARASAALGAPVRIGALRVNSSGWVPLFEIDNVRVLDEQGRDALVLKRAVAALAPRSLLLLQPRLAQLLLDDVSVDIRRDRNGRLSIAGRVLDESADSVEPASFETLFEHDELVVRNATVRWTDEASGAPSLVLQAVDAVLRNDGRQHEVRLDATPPADWGDRFQISGRFTHALGARADDWTRWSGEVFAQLARADVSQLRRHVKLPVDLAEGRGALRAWITFENGAPVRTTADVALEAVSLRLAPALPVLTLQQLEGRIDARRDAQSVSFEVDRLSFLTDDGVRWAPTHWRLALQRAGDGPVTGGALSADRLDLAPMARIAERLPLGAPLHRWVRSLEPQGSVQALTLNWTGAIDAPTAWRAQAQGRALALAAGAPGPAAARGESAAGRPGLSGADVDVTATEAGGQAQLAVSDGALVFPGVFAEPRIPVHSLTAAISWRRLGTEDGAPIEVAVRGARFNNSDTAGTLDGTWTSGAGEGFGPGQRYPGAIALKARLERGAAERVVRYLPLGVPAAAREYVGRSVQGGRVKTASIEVAGDIWTFPYTDPGPGVFKVALAAEDVSFAYIPSVPGFDSPWPALQRVAGTLEFDRAEMRVRDASGTLLGVPLRGVNGGIKDLAREGVLRIDGRARGAANSMLRFVDSTPVGSWLGGALRDTRASGDADLTLALQLPIGEAQRTTLRGTVQMAGNDVRLQKGTPLLAGTRGRVDFTERSVHVTDARVHTLGGDARFEGGTQPDGTLRFSGRGSASIDALFARGELAALAPLGPLARHLRGQAPYALEIGFPHGLAEVRLTSDLTGVVSELPAPLAKPAASSLPLSVRLTPHAAATATDTLEVAIGDTLRARYERDLSGASARIRRGAVAIGNVAHVPALPDSGVVATIDLPRLVVDPWRTLWNHLDDDTPNAAAAPPASADDGVGAFPTRIDVRAGELVVFERRLTNARIDLQQNAQLRELSWQARVRADQAEGQLMLRLPRERAATASVSGRLARLDLVSAAPQATLPALSEAPASAQRPPALDIVVDDLRWQGRALGRMELQAAAARDGRSWRLDALRLTTPDAAFSGNGRWSPGQRMTLDWGLDVQDSGTLANRFGAGDALRGGKGRIDGTVSWAGSPLAPDLASLAGTLRLDLAEGRFLHAEPGAARLLGVLSLQALPRRLLLDFRDVFQEGFRFDKVTGDATISDGVASTDNLRIVGVQAAVVIEGQTDLQRETQNLRVVAVPEINAGAASLAYAAINPAVGIASFLAQLILREPLMAASTRIFRITGSWSDPIVERIERAATVAEEKKP